MLGLSAVIDEDNLRLAELKSQQLCPSLFFFFVLPKRRTTRMNVSVEGISFEEENLFTHSDPLSLIVAKRLKPRTYVHLAHAKDIIST